MSNASILGDLPYFMKLLIQDILVIGVEDPSNYSLAFFKQIRNGNHIINKKFSFITDCTYNRICFVLLCKELFAGFKNDDEISILEYNSYLDLICYDIPKKLINELIRYIDPAYNQDEKSIYKIGDLNSALYFSIIYDEWLKFISNKFNQNSKIYIDDLQKILESNNYSKITDVALIPSQIGLKAVMDDLLLVYNKNDEISFSKFHRELLFNEKVRKCLLRILPIKCSNSIFNINQNTSASQAVNSNLPITTATEKV